MTELEKIFITSLLTIFGGVVVIVGGQIIVKFFIEPLHEQFRLIGEIEDSLIFYAVLYLNPGPGQTAEEAERRDKASEVLRRQSSQLRAKTHAVSGYGLWECLGLALNRADVRKASLEIMGLSQFINRGEAALENQERRKEIEKRLGIGT